MKKITIILLGFIALLAVSCDKDDHLAPDKSKYVYDIPQTDLPVDAIVVIFSQNNNFSRVQSLHHTHTLYITKGTADKSF